MPRAGSARTQKQRAQRRKAQRKFRAELKRLPNPGPQIPRQLSLDVYERGYHWSLRKQIREWGTNHKTEQMPFDLMVRQAHSVGEREAIRATLPSWERLRELVYERDHGICWVCREPVPERHYELGHIVDRVMGGADAPENVVVMCVLCNRAYKDCHATFEEALEWRNKWRNPMDKYIKAYVSTMTLAEIEKANEEFRRMGF